MSDVTRKASIFTFARLLNGTLMIFWSVGWGFAFLAEFIGKETIKRESFLVSPIFDPVIYLTFFLFGIWILFQVFTHIQYNSSEIFVNSLWIKRRFSIRDIVDMRHVKFRRPAEIRLFLIDKRFISLIIAYQGVEFSAELLRFIVKENELKIKDEFIRDICDNY